jgi:hypothetical protein
MYFDMSITKLSSEALLSKTDFLAREERKITLELLEYLREIERRMLYADLGFGSLHDFCVKRLGLSEGSAQRRISAMRLARELPEVKAAILDGNLSLTNAAKLQVAFQAQKRLARESKRPENEDPACKSTEESTSKTTRDPIRELATEEKREFLREITGLTQKECERKLHVLLPSAMAETNREKLRSLGENAHELRLVIDDSLMKKLERLRDLLSHAVPTGSVLDIFERLVDAELARLEKRRGFSTPDQTETFGSDSELSRSSRSEGSGSTPVPTKTVFSRTIRRTLPADTRRTIWRRAKGTCEIAACLSRFRLEIDHITPLAQGGTDEPRNLRLLCRTHNLSEAKRRLGGDLMQKYSGRHRA